VNSDQIEAEMAANKSKVETGLSIADILNDNDTLEATLDTIVDKLNT